MARHFIDNAAIVDVTSSFDYDLDMNEVINRKAKEISFAVLRVAEYIRRFELRQRLEKLSYHLLENVSYKNPEVTLQTIAALNDFVVLCSDLHEITLANAKILQRELDNLQQAIEVFAGIGKGIDVEGFFSNRIQIYNEEKRKKNKNRIIKNPEEIIVKDEEIRNEEIEYGNEEDNKETGNEEENTATRQSAIVKMISSSAGQKLSLKEISTAFPELSTRTIRYDLKKLTELGKIRRQGSGGPSNYYTAAQLTPGVINL